ncbi:hypothetical protein [Amycolatopsis sp. GA6-003]
MTAPLPARGSGHHDDLAFEPSGHVHSTSLWSGPAPRDDSAALIYG